MIQGLLTRPATDDIIKHFVSSAKGTLHTVDNVDINKPITCFGILRGTGELLKQSKEFYYFDHAYLYGNRHKPSKVSGERIYRLTKNHYHIQTIQALTDEDHERIKKYKQYIKLQPWKTDGNYILIIAPSNFQIDYHNISSWVDDTIKTLKQYTDRRIKVRWKNDKRPLKEDIQGAYAVVAHNSAVVVEAIMNGVPVFCDKMNMGVPIGLTDFTKIEQPIKPGRLNWIYSLLANQFTMTEIKNGTAWRKVNENI